MERLICESLLWKTDLTTGEKYNKTLDEMFLENPTNNVLLELENNPSDCDAAVDILQRFWKYECKEFSVDKFGKTLLEDLRAIYNSNIFSIQDYGRKCYSLWQLLPNELHMEEPFHVLSYADDPLSWGDESQTRKIYEEFFDFYK